MLLINNFDVIKSLLITLIVVLWLYWLWTRRHLYRFAMEFPGFFGIPIFGVLTRIKHLNYLLYSFEKFMSECAKYTICIWMGLYPVLLTADPDVIEEVLTSPDFLNKAKQIYSPVFKFFNGGLLANEVPKWQHTRRIFNHSFSHKVLLSLVPTFNKAKNRLVKRFDILVDKGDNPLLHEIMETSFHISAETTLGVGDSEEIDNIAEKFRYIMQKVMDQVFLSFLNLQAIPTWSRKYWKVKGELYSYLDGLLQKNFDRLEAKAAKSNNKDEIAENKQKQDEGFDVFNEDFNGNVSFNENEILDIQKQPMIFIDNAIENYKKEQLTIDELVNEAAFMISASFETSATVIFSTLVLLAMHQDVQERLFDEIYSAFPDKSSEISYRHLQQLPYLDRVVNETLRVIPAIPVIARQVVKDTNISKDVTLPTGLQIIISVYHVHRRKDIWGPDADKFNPDNFLPENMTGRHPYAFIPFSKGARNCIGWRYALINMKIILIGLIRNFKFSTSMKYEELKFFTNIVVRYLKEPLLSIERRD